MRRPLRLISTDFDGTLHADGENPPVPLALQHQLASLQAQGVQWVVNTGRDLSAMMEGLARARLEVRPDFLVVVEREIYIHRDHDYEPWEAWNRRCAEDHARAFETIREELPRLRRWIHAHYDAEVYEDPWSPLCLLAKSEPDAIAICRYLEDFCRERGGVLTVVRNDVYARFSCVQYSKGTALAAIARRLGVSPEETFAAGDHVNDLPMLHPGVAAHLAAPANAVPEVQQTVRAHGGWVSSFAYGHGVNEALHRVTTGMATTR